VANWQASLADLGLHARPGSIALEVLLNKLIAFKAQSFSTSPEDENAGTLGQRNSTLNDAHPLRLTRVTSHHLAPGRQPTFKVD
jgi:hypothetical protein